MSPTSSPASIARRDADCRRTGRRPTAEELHDLRKRVVIHRYQIDIIEPLWPRFVKMWSGEAQRLRDRLGKHQDMLMLASLTGPHRPLARWRSRLTPAIAERQGRACRGRRPHRRAHLRGKAERAPPAARHDVGAWRRQYRRSRDSRYLPIACQQPGDELALPRKNLPARLGGRKPFRAVDLRETTPCARSSAAIPARTGWTSGVAGSKSPSTAQAVTILRPGWTTSPRGRKSPCGARAGLLLEFAPGHRQRDPRPRNIRPSESTRRPSPSWPRTDRRDARAATRYRRAGRRYIGCRHCAWAWSRLGDRHAPAHKRLCRAIARVTSTGTLASASARSARAARAAGRSRQRLSQSRCAASPTGPCRSPG